jgi:hypothetical protein
MGDMGERGRKMLYIEALVNAGKSVPLLCRLGIHRPHEETEPLFTEICLRCGYKWKWTPNG